MTLTTGRSGGGRTRGAASRRGLHLVRPVEEVAAGGGSGADGVEGTARAAHSPGRCAEAVAALAQVTGRGDLTDADDARAPRARTGRGTLTSPGAAAGPRAVAGDGVSDLGTPSARASLTGHDACTGADPGSGPAAGGTDLEQELEERVRALRADGPTVGHRAALADLLVAWAASLVALHRASAPSTAPAVPLPWVLVPDLLAGRQDGPYPVAGRAWAVRQHPRVRRALAAARQGWVADRWVHDGGPDGVLVLRGPRPAHGSSTTGSASPPVGASTTVHAAPPVGASTTDGPGTGARPRSGVGPAGLVPDTAGAVGPVQPSVGPSAELVAAGRGDARWDVATALDWLAVHLAPALDPAWDLDPVAAFMRAYRAHGGDAEPDRALAVARTVATAAAWSDALDARDQEPDEDELAWVAGLWARPLALLAPR